MNRLRVIVSEQDGRLVAQLLELDIVAVASDEAGLLEEISHQIEMEFKLAKHYGQVPFVHLGPAEDRYQFAWKDDQATSLGRLKLSDEAAVALALYLHTDKRDLCVTEYKNAA